MTIETIYKKHNKDYNKLYSDYVSTKSCIMSRTGFNDLFQFDETKNSVLNVYSDNLYSYSDEFIDDMDLLFHNHILCEVDYIDKPQHYNDYPVEVIEIIKRTLTKEQFIGYCLGNEIKYRMRCGLKTSDTQEDIKKAMKYREFRKEVESE